MRWQVGFRTVKNPLLLCIDLSGMQGLAPTCVLDSATLQKLWLTRAAAARASMPGALSPCMTPKVARCWPQGATSDRKCLLVLRCLLLRALDDLIWCP